MVENMLEGVEVRLGVDFLENREALSAEAEKIIFTGMIDAYFNYCLGELEYRGLKFETETLDMENYQGNAVVNFTDDKTPYTRMIEHKHFEFGTQPKTVVTREYPQKWVRGEEPYYPMNDDKNNSLYEKYKELARNEEKVIFGGRLGQYQYYDMDDVIAAALECAKTEL